MKVELDAEVCEAYGLCVMEAPKFFAINVDADKGVVLVGRAIEPRDIAAVEAAARGCPKQAIRLSSEARTDGVG